jgi:hypothetical protein
LWLLAEVVGGCGRFLIACFSLSALICGRFDVVAGGWWFVFENVDCG